MDALALLAQDHDRVKRHFNRIRNAKTPDARRLFFEVKAELDLHSRLEETIFYPVFEKYEELQELVHRCREHHKEFDASTAKIQESIRAKEDFLLPLAELFQMVENHIQEEEQELFPQVRKIMRRSEREHLGRLLNVAKSERAAA